MFNTKLSLLFLFIFLHFVYSESVYNLYFYENAVERNAICNDGTPAGFYFRPATAGGENKFVFHLQGGAWCYDEDSCYYRNQTQNYLMSSNTWAKKQYFSEGIFSQDQNSNYWYNANSIYVQYCSSDNWSGNGSVSYNYNNQNVHWEFRGHSIVKSLVEDLWNKFNMSSASEILFSGCSAGGQGVVVNADFVNEYLKDLGYNGLYKSVADAGWLQNVVPIEGNNIYSIFQQMQKGYALWNGTISPLCAHANPFGNAFYCYMSPYAYPYIKTPIFIQAEQYDTYQLTTYCNCNKPPQTTQQIAWVDELREGFVSSFSQISSPNGLYSAACLHHCSLEDNSYNTIKINGVSFADLLHKWYTDSSSYTSNNDPYKLIDDCNTFNCSVGCPSNNY